jgi:hypothetical protein
LSHFILFEKNHGRFVHRSDPPIAAILNGFDHKGGAAPERNKKSLSDFPLICGHP